MYSIDVNLLKNEFEAYWYEQVRKTMYICYSYHRLYLSAIIQNNINIPLSTRYISSIPRSNCDANVALTSLVGC